MQWAKHSWTFNKAKKYTISTVYGLTLLLHVFRILIGMWMLIFKIMYVQELLKLNKSSWTYSMNQDPDSVYVCGINLNLDPTRSLIVINKCFF